MSDYQVMPPLSDDEYRELEESIRAHGAVLVPVVTDDDGNIIDGYNRSEIAARLGVECPTVVRSGLTDDQKRSMAYELNLNRRHLNREQRRQMVADSLLADPQLSDREHARRTGVSRPTVATVRRELEQSGLVADFASRIGADGVEQAARKEAKVPPAWVERDRELAQEREDFAVQRMRLRWHWTLDGGNPDRVSVDEYAAASNTSANDVRADADGWANWLATQEANSASTESDDEFLARMHAESEARRRGSGFRIPDTIDAAAAAAENLVADIRRLRRVHYEMAFAAVERRPASATKDAYEIGLYWRWMRQLVLWGLEDGQTVEEFADAADVSVDRVQEYLASETTCSDDEYLAKVMAEDGVAPAPDTSEQP